MSKKANKKYIYKNDLLFLLKNKFEDHCNGSNNMAFIIRALFNNVTYDIVLYVTSMAFAPMQCNVFEGRVTKNIHILGPYKIFGTFYRKNKRYLFN